MNQRAQLGEGRRLGRSHAWQVGAPGPDDHDAFSGCALERARRRPVGSQVGDQVEGVMGVLPAARCEEPHRGGQVARHAGPDVTGAAAAGSHAASTASAHLMHSGVQQGGADSAPLIAGRDQDQRDAVSLINGDESGRPGPGLGH
jgi:hypothetical protein